MEARDSYEAEEHRAGTMELDGNQEERGTTEERMPKSEKLRGKEGIVRTQSGGIVRPDLKGNECVRKHPCGEEL